MAESADRGARGGGRRQSCPGSISLGLASVGGKGTRGKVLLLAAKAFMVRKGPKPTDADWEASLTTAKEALVIAEELGLLREMRAEHEARQDSEPFPLSAE